MVVSTPTDIAAEGDHLVASTVKKDRADRLAEMKRQQDAKDRKRRLLIIAAVTVVVLAIAGTVFATIRSSQADKPTLAGVKTYTETRTHVNGKVNYPQTPPAGGPHNQVWLNCGIYTSPVPNENAVHDLEHGAVWITYRPDLPAAQVAQLTALAKGQTYLTLSPYPGLPAPVVVTAWGKQLTLTGASDARLPEFIAQYKESPSAPEPGALCTGGTGTPAV